MITTAIVNNVTINAHISVNPIVQPSNKGIFSMSFCFDDKGSTAEETFLAATLPSFSTPQRAITIVYSELELLGFGTAFKVVDMREELICSHHAWGHKEVKIYIINATVV